MRVIMLLFLLAGCANTPERRAEKAAGMSSPILCYIFYAGNLDDKAAAGPELRRRGFTCTQPDITNGAIEFGNAKQARDAASAAAIEAGVRLLTPPAPPPLPIQCTTTRFGYTTCW